MIQPYALTMNLGDLSEDRVYYLPHNLAFRLGYFDAHELRVTAVRSVEGGATVTGGQIPSVLDGTVDLTIGGPMVTMKLAEDGEQLISFCAAVRSNPWFVLGRKPEPDFVLSDLAEKQVFDLANIGTAGFIFDAVMAEQGISALRFSQGKQVDVDAFLDSDCPYAIHHLHGVAKGMAQGRLFPLCSLAPTTGGVPWSAYISRPDVIAAKRSAFIAFTRAIADALSWLATANPAQVADVIAPDFPDLDPETMAQIISLYREGGLWPTDHRIPAQDILRFGHLLRASGWITDLPNPEVLTRDLLKDDVHG